MEFSVTLGAVLITSSNFYQNQSIPLFRDNSQARLSFVLC